MTKGKTLLFSRIALAVLLAAPQARADEAFTSPRTAWFREAKYGMFIHWGIYAVPAGEWNGQKIKGVGEWIMHRAKIPIPEYEKFAAQFNPVKFNAREWVRVARNAGMKYLVITSKHHDGFSMYDTKVNDYDIVDATPFKRDPMQELAAACKAEGIKFGFYYSIMDWHHPNANKQNAERYIGQMKEQLRELVIKYDPALLWFDGEWVDWWDQEKGKELEKFLRALKPALIINNRIGKRKMTDGDYETPEQTIPKAAMGTRLWETCMTLNDTWGYKRDDHNWKSPQEVVRKLADIASKGGNFLLNVGPDAQGVIPPESVRILEDAGRWLQENGEAIYGTTFAPLPQPAWGRITRKGSRLYLVVFGWPADGQPLRLALKNPVTKATLLKGGASIKVQASGDGGVDLLAPAAAPSSYASVIAVEFTGELERVPTTAAK
jgi:alpha-L-fucosidase